MPSNKSSPIQNYICFSPIGFSLQWINIEHILIYYTENEIEIPSGYFSYIMVNISLGRAPLRNFLLADQMGSKMRRRFLFIDG
jgi:hypothetical protein